MMSLTNFGQLAHQHQMVAVDSPNNRISLLFQWQVVPLEVLLILCKINNNLNSILVAQA
jgi:hypothetical protein